MEVFKPNQKLESGSVVHYDGINTDGKQSEESMKAYQKNLCEAMY